MQFPSLISKHCVVSSNYDMSRDMESRQKSLQSISIQFHSNKSSSVTIREMDVTLKEFDFWYSLKQFLGETSSQVSLNNDISSFVFYS